MIFFYLFIIISMKINLGKYPLPIWKGLSALNMHISIWNEYLQNWRQVTQSISVIFSYSDSTVFIGGIIAIFSNTSTKIFQTSHLCVLLYYCIHLRCIQKLRTSNTKVLDICLCFNFLVLLG